MKGWEDACQQVPHRVDIKENVNTCCAITMEPDEVLELIEKLKKHIENG